MAASQPVSRARSLASGLSRWMAACSPLLPLSLALRSAATRWPTAPALRSLGGDSQRTTPSEASVRRDPNGAIETHPSLGRSRTGTSRDRHRRAQCDRQRAGGYC
eukprot:2943861-Prymnesium_polylepis.1